MKIIALVENESLGELQAAHGLSLYIETRKHKILFDVGNARVLFNNAKKRGIQLSEIDTVILSHGHVDHGGALAAFLKVNTQAKVYVQRSAFEAHYYKLGWLKLPVGIRKNLIHHSQMVILDGEIIIDDELTLFTVSQRNNGYSRLNHRLYMKKGRDDFCHEQNLIIQENKQVLIMGCGHAGVLNMMSDAQKYHPDVCIGGYHLYDGFRKQTVSDTLLETLSIELKKYSSTQFFTCHCTGKKAYEYLSKQMDQMNYLHCGDELNI